MFLFYLGSVTHGVKSEEIIFPNLKEQNRLLSLQLKSHFGPLNIINLKLNLIKLSLIS